MIYPSTKVRPYIYFGIHKETGQIYIGYREKNVRLNKPSHIDLLEYRTSSKVVNPIFDQFDWIITAEFETGNDAFDFEQQLIFENWGNPLLLNEQYRLSNGKKRFKAKKGQGKGRKDSSETKVKKQKSALASDNAGRFTDCHSPWNKDLVGSNNPLFGRIRPEEVKQKLRKPKSTTINMCKPKTEKHRENMRGEHTTISCPHCPILGGERAMKRWHFDNCKYLKGNKG